MRRCARNSNRGTGKHSQKSVLWKNYRLNSVAIRLSRICIDAHAVATATPIVFFSIVSLLLNLPYTKTVELTFENFLRSSNRSTGNILKNLYSHVVQNRADFVKVQLFKSQEKKSAGCCFMQTKILKNHPATKFTIQNDCGTDF